MEGMIATLSTALQDRYAIDREIGRGGMATVYLARDIRHNRRVALKVLNPELGAVLGVERFLAEIQVTANLQHPNLLPLFDSGEANGHLFYVMPFVEGESLRARLDREKQLPVDEAIRIAIAIAGALDYAHRHNVIHRDLKPENILMQEGQPLIADFGIALAVSNAGGSRVTQTGVSLGTPQYMSPEQAMADRTLDGRSDIYSLGAMTYEMLVGDPPHWASTSQAVLAKVLTERPASVRINRPSTPAHVDVAVARALEKLPADRFATAREFADALGGKVATAPVSTVPAPPPAIRVPRREIVAWALLAALAAWVGWTTLRREPMESPKVIRANLDLPPGIRVNDVMAGATLALSPGGDLIAYTSSTAADYNVYVRRVNELTPRVVARAAGRNLTFSPDGRWLAYTEGNVLRKVLVDGGEPVTVTSSGGTVPYGLTWGPNDTLYVGTFGGIWAVPASGGTGALLGGAEALATRVGRRWPYLLPGTQTLVFAGGSSSAAPPRISIFDLASDTVVEFDDLLGLPLGLLYDQLVYISPAGGLMAIGWDRGATRPVGEPVQMDEGLLFDPTAGVKASLSASGSIVYLKGRAQVQPVITAGGDTPSVPLLKEPGTYANARFSPDGSRVAVSVFSPTVGSTDIWIYDIRRNTFTRLTTEGENIRPEWSPDGKQVVYIGRRGDHVAIYRQPSDGSGPAEVLYHPDVEPFEVIMSPDGQWLVYRTSPGARYSRDILAVPLTGEKKVLEIVVSPVTESQPRLSPDGRWLAYQSNESGRFEIYVRPFPGPGARVQVSDRAGTEALWGRNGKLLYYRGDQGEVVQVDVTTGDDFAIGTRRVVVPSGYLTDTSHPNWDVAPDGRFLMLNRAGAEAQAIIVHNWGTELRAATAQRK
jgi:serine/threonine-protein kinase